MVKEIRIIPETGNVLNITFNIYNISIQYLIITSVSVQSFLQESKVILNGYLTLVKPSSLFSVLVNFKRS